jgi:hypothetical protein
MMILSAESLPILLINKYFYMKLINTLYLMLILVIVGTSTVNAQNIILGTGTTTNATTTASPINIWYRSLRYQTVYTAAELQAAGAAPGQILQMGWYVTQVPLYDMPNYSIKMKHTTATNTAAHDGVGLTQVYSNTLYAPTAGGWDMLTLQTPFLWNGVDNILVDVCFDQTNPTYNTSGQVRTYAVPTGAIYVRSDAAPQCGNTTTAVLPEKPQVNFFIQSGPPPTCSMIDNVTLAATNVLAYSATLSWDSTNSPQYFLIEYGTSGFLPGGGTYDTTSNLSIGLTGLTPATTYSARVSQVCGSAAGDTSYFRSVDFTTPCATFMAPFNQNFAGSTTPICWNQTAATGGPWVFTGNPGYLGAGTVSHTADGSSYAWIDFSTTHDDVALELPNVDISPLTAATLQFWYKSVIAAGQANNIIRVEAFNGTTWSVLGTIQQNSPDWEYHSYSLVNSIYNTNLVKVRFVADPDPVGGTLFYNDLMLDDIKIDNPPAFDAKGTDFLAPVIGGCNILTNSEIVTVEVSNVGSDTISSALVKLFINGTQVASGTYNGMIEPGGSVSYTFPNGVNLAAAGQKIIRVSASALPNEDVPWNDETTFVKFNDGNSLVNTYPYTQKFDTWNTCLSNCVDNGCGTFGQTSGWRNAVGSDDSDWSVQTGATPTGGTGPTADHTSGTGNYLYTEAAGCNNFELLTPCFNFNANIPFPELSFYYHMRGTNVGTLTIEADTTGVGNYVPVWTLSGNQGNNWIKATIDLTAFAGYVTKFRFKVVMANGTSSDIAIDDVLLRNVPPHDMQVTSVLGPNDGCGDEDVYIDVTVFNYGSFTESDYTVTVAQTGLTTNSISVLGTVALLGEDSTVVSVGPFTTALGGVVNYNALVEINNATDLVPANNSKTYQHKAYAISFPQGVDGSRCGFGEVDLGATGIATQFFWYDDSLATSFIDTGASFTTGYLYQDATYWLEGRAPFTDFVGEITNTVDEGGHYDYYPDGLKFDAYYDVTLESVQVYPLSPGDIVVNVEDAQGNLLHTTTFQHLTTATKITIPLGFVIPVGTDYRINATGTTTQLYRNKDNNNAIALTYPYNLDNAMSITRPINNLMNSYYFFYNWEVTYLGCPSERIPVQAIINPSGLTPNFAVTNESLPGNGAINTTVTGGASPYSFNWSNGVTGANLAGLNAGTYLVTISDATGCTDTFSTVVDYTVGTEEIASIANLDIFPNPSNGQFNVSIELDGIHEVSIEVINTLGQVIYRTSPESIAARQYAMNLKDVPSGLYQIRVKVDNESLSRTIMINARN